MFRAFVASILMLLVALPHGVCFCDFVHASSHENETACDAGDCTDPAPPPDEPDDHDDDCACKLRDVMALPQERTHIDQDSIPMEAVSLSGFSATSTIAFSLRRTLEKSLDQPAAPILCALRI